jgi:peptidyl-prolyl cis-trans isomerase SurA
MGTYATSRAGAGRCLAAGARTPVTRRPARARISAVSAGLLGALLCGAVGPVGAEVVDRVVAAIDGEPVTLHDLEIWGRERGATGEVSAQVLDAYVTEQLLTKEAETQGVQVTDKDVDRYIADVRAAQGLDDAAFTRALREQGMTLESYREVVRSEIRKSELINREIRSRVSVAPEQVRRHYEAHADQYSLAERVQLRMILIPVPPETPPAEQAHLEAFVRALHAQLDGGADFSEMARKYSAGPGAGEGGDLGWFERGQMVKPLEDVAFRLPAGALSSPIRNSAGFSILKVEAREGHQSQPFEAVEVQIREELYQAALVRRYEDWLKKGLRETHHVEILW